MTKSRSVSAIANDNSTPGSRLVDGSVDAGKLDLADSIQNSDISATASISYSKLDLAESVVDGDVSPSAGISSSKLSYELNEANSELRTVYSKLSDVISVMDFIPPGTDTETTDCTAYIQAAIDAHNTTPAPYGFTNGGAIYFPAGRYLITGDGISINKTGVSLIGESTTSTVLLYNGTGVCVDVVQPVNELSFGRFYLRNIGFEAIGDAVDTATGVQIKNTHGSTWVSITFSKFSRAIYCITCYMNQILGISCLPGGTSGAPISYAISGTGGNRHWTIKGGIIRQAIDLTEWDNNVIEDIDFEPSTGPIKTGTQNHFLRCRFEQLPILWDPSIRYEPWLYIGNAVTVEKCTFAWSGNPVSGLLQGQYVVRFEGDNAVVDMGVYIYTGTETIEFAPGSTGNTAIINYPANQYANSGGAVQYKAAGKHAVNNSQGENYVRWSYGGRDVIETYRPDGQFSLGTGFFYNYLTGTENLISSLGSGEWTNSSPVPAVLPSTFPVGYKSQDHYIKLQQSVAGYGTRGALNWTGVPITVTETDYYTLSFAYKTTGRGEARFGLDGSFWYINGFNGDGVWRRLNYTTKVEAGQTISNISITFFTNPGEDPAVDALNIGEISLNRGYTQPFIPTGVTPLGLRLP